MKLHIAIFVAVLLLPAMSFAQARGSYLNYRYAGLTPGKNLPNGVKHLGGGMLGDFEAETVYSVSQVQRGRTKMLWLEASTGKDSSGITGWKVLDVLSFPNLTKADHLLFADDPSTLCRKNRKDIPNLVGVGRINMRRGVFTPSRLWTANLTTGKFVPLKLTGVKCVFSAP